MVLAIAKELVYNFALLLMLCVIYEVRFLIAHHWTKCVPIVNGLLIATIGICIMSLPFNFADGIFFDARAVLISVTAITFGAIPTIIAAGILIVFRFFVGGSGLWMGELTIVLAAFIGLLWNNRLATHSPRRRLLDIYLFGLTVHAAMVLCMLVLPWPIAVQALRVAALPILILLPLGTVLLSALLLHQKERDDASQRILEAESRYMSIFNDNLAIMLLIDSETGGIVDVNPAASSYYGWPDPVMKTMSIDQIITLPKEELFREIEKAKAEKYNYFLFKHRKASGQIVDVEVYNSPIRLNGKTMLFSIVHDISLKVQTENARLESEERFRSLVEGAPDAIFIETQERFVFVNQMALQLFGATSCEALLGSAIIERFHPLHRKVIEVRLQNLRTGTSEHRPEEAVILRLDGSPVYAEITSVPITYNSASSSVLFVRDISERKLLEREKQEMEIQMRQQQKLEAIGTLAGGVAHEINNPINGIMNYAQLIVEDSCNSTKSIEFANEIVHETERVSTIVRNLLHFSRQEKESHSLASIYDIVNQTMSLIRTVIRKDQIELKVLLDQDLPLIKCRSQQIEQVLMNLLTNARDALKEKYPGYHKNKIIKLTCKQVDLEGQPWLRLVVRDNGIGIPQNLHSRIFEPFFSTKPRDIGTGLGLSISFGIIKDHSGRMSFVTKEGQFTEFTIDLPVEARTKEDSTYVQCINC